MKKLLIFHPYLAPYRIDVYNELAMHFELKVLLIGSESERATLGFDLDAVNEQAKFDYEYYDRGFWLGRHLVSPIYYEVIRNFRPHLVMSHELGLNTLAAIALKPFFGYKIYTTIDDSPAMAVSYGMERALLRRFVFGHIDGALVVSPAVKGFLERRYPNLRCRFLYFPIIQDDRVLSEKINAAKSKADEYICTYGLKGKKIVLFVGRMESVKCPEMLLRAYQSLGIEDAMLVFVGKGSLKESIDAYIADNNLSGRVLTMGALSGRDLYAWYYLAHIFVLPSRFEPFGAVVNEALVAGCRTIVSDKVGASCLVTKQIGVVFKTDDADGLKTSLAALLESTPVEKAHKSLMPQTFAQHFNNLYSFLCT